MHDGFESQSGKYFPNPLFIDVQLEGKQLSRNPYYCIFCKNTGASYLILSNRATAVSTWQQASLSLLLLLNDAAVLCLLVKGCICTPKDLRSNES